MRFFVFAIAVAVASSSYDFLRYLEEVKKDDIAQQVEDDRVMVCAKASSAGEVPRKKGKEFIDGIVKESRYERFEDMLRTGSFEQYLKKLIPHAAALIVGLVFLVAIFGFLVPGSCCCFGACCMCCHKPKDYTDGWNFKKVLYILLFVGLSIAMAVMAFQGYAASTLLDKGMKHSVCGAYMFADMTINGEQNVYKIQENEPHWVGIDNAINELQTIQAKLVEDSPFHKTLMSFIDATKDIETESAKLNNVMTDLPAVFTLPTNDMIKEAASDLPQIFYTSAMAQLTGSDDFKAVIQAIDSGVAKGLEETRKTVTDQLTGDKLVKIHDSVGAGIEPLQKFRSSLVDQIFRKTVEYRQRVMQAVKSQNVVILVFSILILFCVLFSILSMILIFYKGYPAQRAQSRCLSFTKFASFSWFCTFVFAVLALIIGGIFAFLIIPAADGCNWTNLNLTVKGMEEWSDVLFKGDTSGKTTKIATSCLVRGADGDVLGALGISEQLNFKNTINEQFDKLEKSMKNGKLGDQKAVKDLSAAGKANSGLFIVDNNSLKTAYDKLRGPQQAAIHPDIFKMLAQTGLHPTRDYKDIQSIQKLQDWINGGTFTFKTNNWNGGKNVLLFFNNKNFFSSSMTIKEPVPLATEKVVDLFDISDANIADVLAVNGELTGTSFKVLVKMGMAMMLASNLHVYSCGGPGGCNLEQFTTYSEAQWDRFDSAVAQLDTTTANTQDKITKDMRNHLNTGILDPVDQLIEDMNCRFMSKSINHMLDAFCYASVPGIYGVSSSWIALGSCALIAGFLMFLIWRRLLVAKRDGAALMDYADDARGVELRGN